jgi:hypothetical protein
MNSDFSPADHGLGTLGNSEVFDRPSSILMMRWLPEAYSTSPRATLTCFVAAPVVVVVSVCTCAIMLTAKTKNSPTESSAMTDLRIGIPGFILSSPDL